MEHHIQVVGNTIYKILNYSYNVNFSYIEKNIKYIYNEINNLNK